MKKLSFTPKIGEKYWYITVPDCFHFVKAKVKPLKDAKGNEIYDGEENRISDYNLFQSKEKAEVILNMIKFIIEKSSDKVVGAIRIGDSTHVVNSKEDIKKLAEKL